MEDLQFTQTLLKDPDSFWPIIWDFLNIMAALDANMPEILACVSDNLPCSECKQHSADYVSSKPKDTPALQYVLDLHNLVNKRNGKEERAMEKYLDYINTHYWF